VATNLANQQQRQCDTCHTSSDYDSVIKMKLILIKMHDKNACVCLSVCSMCHIC